MILFALECNNCVAARSAPVDDRPDAFSIPCALQSLNKTASDECDPQDDLMVPMQLIVTDSTTGLSDKDVKKLAHPCL